MNGRGYPCGLGLSIELDPREGQQRRSKTENYCKNIKKEEEENTADFLGDSDWVIQR